MTTTIKELAVKTDGMTPEQVELIKNTVAKGASDNELKLFLMVAKRSGLDPFSRQIHFVKRGDTGTIQTGIDGYRAIAEHSGTLAGIDDAVFDSEETKNPKKASVTVYRIVNGNRAPFTASARWDEYAAMYNGRLGTMWQKMPYLMLAKCAEALALRKAFPNDLSGLYTNEEMQQAGGYDVTPVADNAPVIVSGSDTDEPEVPEDETDQKKTIMEFVKQLDPKTKKWTKKGVETFIADKTQLALVPENYIAIIKALNEEIFKKM